MNMIDDDMMLFRSKIREAVARILGKKELDCDVGEYVAISEFDLDTPNGDMKTVKAIANEIGADELGRFHDTFLRYSGGNSVFGWTLIDGLNDEEKEMMRRKLEAFRLSRQIEALMDGIDENKGD